jgi:colanic acid/amylovoran biosynthesis glycosyltransferase
MQNEYERFSVLHAVDIWLEQTQTWIFSQIVHLPPHIKNHVVCEFTKNLDQFALTNIHSFETARFWRNIYDRGLRKLGVRRHLGFVTAVGRTTAARILHSHFGPVAWTNIEPARTLGLKHIVTFYGYDVSQVPRSDPRWQARYAQLFETADLVLCEGPYMAGSIVALGCPPSKVEVHHLGVALANLPFQPRFWRPGEPLKILIAASFREKKGIPYGLQALGRLQSELELEVTIIGDGGSQEKQKILDTIAQSGLGGKVRMLGIQPHGTLLQEAYRNHIYLAPSVTARSGDTEGGAPVTIIELAATGMPVVSTRHCDIPEVIQDGVGGLLAQERDVEGLVAHLRWLVANPDQWHAMVLRARAHVEQGFAARTQGLRLGQIYSRVTEAR